MSSIIRIKRSQVSGNPTTLAAGELAYSALPDNGSNGGDRLYVGIGTETGGNAANHVVIGGKYFTDQITAATSTNTTNTIVKRDASGNFSANTITATLSGNATSATKLANARNITITGDAAATIANFDGSSDISTSITLANINNNTGTFGSSTQIPVLTVNSKGLITAVSTQTFSSASTLNIAGGTGTDVVNLSSDTLTFTGGTGVATTVTNNQVSFAIGQSVATTDNVTFAGLTVTNNVVVNGNLTVNGTTTTVNSTTVDIKDLNVTIAKDALTAAEANGAGLTVAGANATFTYTSANDRWNLNKNLNVTTVYGALSGNASTASKWQSPINISLTGDATATFTSVDGSSNASTALTLSNTSVSAGSYGSSNQIATFTVDSKGRLTSATNTSIVVATNSVLGIASFDSSNFSVTSGSVSINNIDGGTY